MGGHPEYGHEFSGRMKSEVTFYHAENQRENGRFCATELLVKATYKNRQN